MESKKPEKQGFRHDLLADLRNRRLIPVIIALVAAIIAVPILISGPGSDASDEAAVGSGSVALDPAATSEAFPAVLAQQPVLRDTETRLDGFKKKNPFKQQLTGPTKREQRAIEKALKQEQQAQQGAGGAGGGDASGASASDALGAVAGTSDSGTSGSGTSGSGGSDSGGSDSGGESSSGTPTDSGGGDSGGPTAEEGIILFTYEVDVRVGPVGETKKKKGVEQLDFLPNDLRRVFQFVKSDFEGTKATFAVNPSAEELNGDGKCTRNKRNDCELLKLKQGDEHRFSFGPNDRIYRLKLNKIIRKSEFVPADEVDDLRADGSIPSFDD